MIVCVLQLVQASLPDSASEVFTHYAMGLINRMQVRGAFKF
jgi:hypothetical protein